MKRTVLDTVLAVMYLPLCLFCFLMHMATEGILIYTDPLNIFLSYFVGYSGPIIALTAYPCLIISTRLRAKGKQKTANILRIAPILSLVCVLLIEQILKSFT